MGIREGDLISAPSPSGGPLNRDFRNRIEESLADKVRSYGIDDVDVAEADSARWQRRKSRSAVEIGERERGLGVVWFTVDEQPPVT